MKQQINELKRRALHNADAGAVEEVLWNTADAVRHRVEQ